MVFLSELLLPSSNSIHPTLLPGLTFSYCDYPTHRRHHRHLSTPLPASLGQTRIKPSFLPWANHKGGPPGEGKKNPGEEECATNPRKQMCLALGPTLGPAQKPCARGITLFSPRSNHLFTEKKLKKYKLLLCKIKVPLSGASG